jgi:hypothetical protein
MILHWIEKIWKHACHTFGGFLHGGTEPPGYGMQNEVSIVYSKQGQNDAVRKRLGSHMVQVALDAFIHVSLIFWSIL